MRKHTLIGIAVGVAAIGVAVFLATPGALLVGQNDEQAAVDPGGGGGALSVSDARLVMPDTAGEEAALYLTIANPTQDHAYITAVAVENAASAELRDPRAARDLRQANLDIEPGETIRLEPGGSYIGVAGYNEEVVPGRTVTVRLRMDDAAELTFPAIVQIDTRQEG